MANLTERLEENQTVERSALIIAGTTLIPVGIALVQTSQGGLGLAIILSGIVCLLARELLKLKRI